jgi:hypothetical protein
MVAVGVRQRVEADAAVLLRRVGETGLARQRLIPAIEKSDLNTQVAVSGVSCRQQISHFSQRTPRHVVEVLRDALAE